MGACYNSFTIEDITPSELREHVKTVIDDAVIEYGNRSYTGSYSEKSGVEIRSDLTFKSYEEAEDWVLENNDKWGPLTAVHYTVPDEKAYKKEEEKLLSIMKKNEIKYQKANAAYQEKRLGLEKALQEGKSSFRGCKTCGSKVATSYLTSTDCPVCSNSLLSTTDLNRIESLLKKRTEAHEAFEKSRYISRILGEMEIKSSGVKRWLVGGWCSE